MATGLVAVFWGNPIDNVLFIHKAPRKGRKDYDCRVSQKGVAILDIVVFLFVMCEPLENF